MNEASTKMDGQDAPELKREQLGQEARGKFYNRFVQGSSNVVVLRPEIHQAIPTSEAVNNAQATLLAFAQETKALAKRSSTKPPKWRTA